MTRDFRVPHSHIVKGRPIFRRHLYISTLLFAFIILVTSFILIRLGMDSLRDRISSQIASIGELNSQFIRDQIQILNVQMNPSDLEAEARRNTQLKTYLDSLITDQDELLYIFIQDLRGEILWKSTRRGRELEQNHFSKVLFYPKNPRSPRMELPSLSNPPDEITDLILPVVLSDQSQVIIHLGLNYTFLERQFSLLRGVLLNRVLLGASIVVGVLCAALLYILWLLKRAQVVEAEAHTADQLAYLGTLASGLAHEIRNPLNAMNLNLQMIEEEVNPAGDSELAGLLKGTKQEMARLARLATNFLMYAKPVSIEKRLILLPDLLEEVTRLISRECQQSGIQLIHENSGQKLEVTGDRDLLKQAILNLLVNAQDAVIAKAGGEKVILVGSASDGKDVQVTVRDSGPGISAEDGRNLFKLFYSSKRGGTGLGLPIAQKIVDSHGGNIDWKNRAEGGAEFTVHLPSLRE